MEDNADWLANNKIWKKWNRIGDGGVNIIRWNQFS